jgi:hypothetical protein
MLCINYQQDKIHIGKLSLKRTRWLPKLKPLANSIHIASHDLAEKKVITDYISTIYKNHYGASILINYPHLISLNDDEGKILAAAGIRYASSEALFLEQYIDQNIETIIDTPRGDIVEIGNLASDESGASLYLFIALSAYLSYQGYSKAVITSTESLQKRFSMMGLNPRILATASPKSLNKKDEDWGSYYQSNPHVLVGSIHESYKKFQCYSTAKYTPSSNILLAGGF